MIRALLLSFALVVFSGCSPNGPPVHFVVPTGFTGEIRLVLDESDGAEIKPIHGKFTYSIPPSGILRVRSYKPLERLHVQTAAYENGTPIPQDYETWTGPLGEKPNLGRGAIVFHGGWAGKRGEEPEVSTYFIGSTVDFEEWQKNNWSQ